MIKIDGIGMIDMGKVSYVSELEFFDECETYFEMSPWDDMRVDKYLTITKDTFIKYYSGGNEARYISQEFHEDVKKVLTTYYRSAKFTYIVDGNQLVVTGEFLDVYTVRNKLKAEIECFNGLT